MFRRFATRISEMTGSPVAFALACILILVWAASGPVLAFSEVWQLTINTTTTIVTFLMVFLIQSSQNSDTRAMQTKLDELITHLEGPRDELAGIEETP